MDLSFLIENINIPVVLAGCLVTGYIVKKWIKDVDNKYIPTIVAVEGAVLNCLYSGANLESVIYGAVCGLASTGLHQAFTRLIENSNQE